MAKSKFKTKEKEFYDQEDKPDEIDAYGLYEEKTEESIDDFLIDEHQLKKDNAKLNRRIKNLQDDHIRDIKKLEHLHSLQLATQEKFHQDIISSLRDQIKQMLEKNWELKDASNLFLKGLDHLKKEGVRVTETTLWNRKGVHGTLESTIARLASNGRRIVSVVAMKVTHQGDTIEAMIVTEHIDKYKKQ